MADMDISERRVPQDGGITVIVQKRAVDLRVSTMPTKFGEKVVIRIIDNRNAIVSLDRLGFSAEMLETWKTVIDQANGVVLVTGPTGSGKSTTLYSVLTMINSEHGNLCTVEDPIEANIPGIYVDEPPNRKVNPALKDLWQKKGDKEFRKEEIIERVLTDLTREIDLIMQEGVVADTRDVDLAMIMGAGWPFFMGGVTMYLDMAGYTPKVLQKVFFTF